MKSVFVVSAALVGSQGAFAADGHGIGVRLDRKGDHIDRRQDRKGQRIDRRLDRRALAAKRR